MENNIENHKLFKVNHNAIIQNNSGEILVLQTDGKWKLPGGRLEENETWLEGLRREIKEETGIENFTIEKILNVDLSDSGNTYIVTFLCKIEDNPEIKLSDEHQKYAWVGEKEVKGYQFWHERIKERLITFLRQRDER